jgi:hypothetical protein
MTFEYQSDFTRKYDKFEYHLEDFDCSLCANRNGKHKCNKTVCEFQALKDEAVKQNRIKRPRGWFKCDME